jgi:hypothetical protein
VVAIDSRSSWSLPVKQLPCRFGLRVPLKGYSAANNEVQEVSRNFNISVSVRLTSMGAVPRL